MYKPQLCIVISRHFISYHQTAQRPSEKCALRAVFRTNGCAVLFCDFLGWVCGDFGICCFVFLLFDIWFERLFLVFLFKAFLGALPSKPPCQRGNAPLETPFARLQVYHFLKQFGI